MNSMKILIVLLFIIALPVIICLISLAFVSGAVLGGYLVHYWWLGMIFLVCCIFAAVHGWNSGCDGKSDSPQGLTDERKQKIAELNARARNPNRRNKVSCAEKICQRK